MATKKPERAVPFICVTLMDGSGLHLSAHHIVELTASKDSTFVKLAYPTEVVSYEVKETAKCICEALCSL